MEIFAKEKIDFGPVRGPAVCVHLGGDFRALCTATWKRGALLLSKENFVIFYHFQTYLLIDGWLHIYYALGRSGVLGQLEAGPWPTEYPWCTATYVYTTFFVSLWPKIRDIDMHSK